MSRLLTTFPTGEPEPSEGVAAARIDGQEAMLEGVAVPLLVEADQLVSAQEEELMTAVRRLVANGQALVGEQESELKAIEQQMQADARGMISAQQAVLMDIGPAFVQTCNPESTDGLKPGEVTIANLGSTKARAEAFLNEVGGSWGYTSHCDLAPVTIVLWHRGDSTNPQGFYRTSLRAGLYLIENASAVYFRFRNEPIPPSWLACLPEIFYSPRTELTCPPGVTVLTGQVPTQTPTQEPIPAPRPVQEPIPTPIFEPTPTPTPVVIPTFPTPVPLPIPIPTPTPTPVPTPIPRPIPTGGPCVVNVPPCPAPVIQVTVPAESREEPKQGPDGTCPVPVSAPEPDAKIKVGYKCPPTVHAMTGPVARGMMNQLAWFGTDGAAPAKLAFTELLGEIGDALEGMKSVNDLQKFISDFMGS